MSAIIRATSGFRRYIGGELGIFKFDTRLYGDPRSKRGSPQFRRVVQDGFVAHVGPVADGCGASVESSWRSDHVAAQPLRVNALDRDFAKANVDSSGRCCRLGHVVGVIGNALQQRRNQKQSCNRR
jgi:hypothetical protein